METVLCIYFFFYSLSLFLWRFIFFLVQLVQLGTAQYGSKFLFLMHLSLSLSLYGTLPFGAGSDSYEKVMNDYKKILKSMGQRLRVSTKVYEGLRGLYGVPLVAGISDIIGIVFLVAFPFISTYDRSHPFLQCTSLFRVGEPRNA